ncbi:hypothetical protein CHL76_04490 [Marinococcus halophilus]|uniref:Uncharacterized protein n=1 Tax=Marinococcus halophilus TaxID=1371 RepID=A0A510Y5V9_MARHA|nr:hypothetical protein [Marinococcus halophilus]OZT81040.1 hypothetical protein CHL76_04490 [Marinococcus halophilus]GEK58749.1 hypothetical protein MHA01_16540 [Marinococcus halophilus]
MEQLFELVFNNLWILLLLFGGLITFMGRGDSSQQQDGSGSDSKKRGGAFGKLEDLFEEFENARKENTPNRPQNDPSGRSGSHPTRRVPEAEAELYKEEADEPQNKSAALKEYEKRREELQQQKKNASQRLERASRQSAEHGSVMSEGEIGGRRRNPHAINKKEAANGLVWAEVLSPPVTRRSGYPYQRQSTMSREIVAPHRSTKKSSNE